MHVLNRCVSVHDVALSSIELCAGVGMLGEGFAAALRHLGIEHRTVCYVEREAAAAGQLAALMEAGALAAAPVWSDLLTFDGDAWRGKVDCLVAGFPCQDLSIAGRRAGLDGKRSGLFFDILDLADHCGAWLLALENVSAIATATASVVDEEEGELDERAAARVVGELADRGWGSEWITISASDVGASHGRERWFCLAWRVGNPDGQRGDRRWAPGIQDGCAKSANAGRHLADADGIGRRGEGHREQQPVGPDWGGLPLFAPGPAAAEWGGIISASPWLAPATEPGVRMLADGVAIVVDESRGHQLRQVGNGVVPLQAGLAFVVLARRAGLFC